MKKESKRKPRHDIIAFRVDAVTRAQLDAKAHEQNRTLSNLIKCIIADYLKQS